MSDVVRMEIRQHKKSGRLSSYKVRSTEQKGRSGVSVGGFTNKNGRRCLHEAPQTKSKRSGMFA